MAAHDMLQSVAAVLVVLRHCYIIICTSQSNKVDFRKERCLAIREKIMLTAFCPKNHRIISKRTNEFPASKEFGRGMIENEPHCPSENK